MSEYYKQQNTFRGKIEKFKNHPAYNKLLKMADEAEQTVKGYGLKSIIALDFIQRIVAMPEEYIKDWLNGKNKLEWRPEDKRMLEAICGQYVDLFLQYPDMRIRKITKNNIEFYEDLGFQLLKTEADFAFVGKKEN